MTDVIAEASKVANCQSANSQDAVHEKWRGLNVPTVKARYPEFVPYVDCLMNYLSRNFSSQSAVIEAGGVNNPTAKATCIAKFEIARKNYCINQVKTAPSTPIIAAPSGSEALPIERDLELIKKKIEADVLEKEAELKKKAADAQEQAVASVKERLSAGKTAVLKTAISLIPKPPVNPRVLQAAQLIAQARQAARKKAADAKDTVSKAKEQYSFPLAPIPPQPAAGLTPAVTPTIPIQPPAIPTIETNFPPDPDPIKIKYGVRIKNSRRNSITFEIAQIQIGNDNMVNAPFGVCPITVNTGDEVQAIERITQIIRTNSFCGGNDPQPDFTYPGGNNINWNALIY